MPRYGDQGYYPDDLPMPGTESAPATEDAPSTPAPNQDVVMAVQRIEQMIATLPQRLIEAIRNG